MEFPENFVKTGNASIANIFCFVFEAQSYMYVTLFINNSDLLLSNKMPIALACTCDARE